MSPIIIAIISQLIPVLVRLAERLFPGASRGVEKHAWVVGMVTDVLAKLEQSIPGWTVPVVEALKPVIDGAIETALEALGI